jgi:hypothetical protein
MAHAKNNLGLDLSGYKMLGIGAAAHRELCVALQLPVLTLAHELLFFWACHQVSA